MDVSPKKQLIYDPIYGFIPLTNLEWEIIHSPFYQRLRWIKQLGFSSYVFPGAEHSRFGHSIGVMHNAHKILESCQRAVPTSDLFNDHCFSKEAIFHKSIRMAALLHDLGAFPFSHTTEGAYTNFGESLQSVKGKKTSNDDQDHDHENLGSYIITNTNYENGITHILKKYGLDPLKVSNLVRGKDPSIFANQILHSEIDCDRMDYLLRDAHFTGINYGSYDWDYLLHHFKVVNIAGEDILTIKDNALHSVEHFLMARFAWYSQVIRSARGAKFDAIAEEFCSYLLKKGKVYKYQELFELIKTSPLEFFQFNDSYFMSKIQQGLIQGEFDKNPKIKDMAEILIFEKGPKTIKCEEFKQRLLNQDETHKIEKVLKRAKEKILQIEDIISKKGGPNDWIVTDFPKKYIMFVKSHHRIVRSKIEENILLERDPVKISFDNGDVKLLAEVENSIISRLQNTFNFVPNVFCSESAYQLLKSEGIID